MFTRRLYYDKNTLTVLYKYMMQGNIIYQSAKDVAEREGLTNYAYFEWTEPDTEIEAQFAAHNTVEVQLVDGKPTLVFSDVEAPEIPREIDDMRAALELLGVQPVEEG